MNILQLWLVPLFGRMGFRPDIPLDPTRFFYERDFRYTPGKHIQAFVNKTEKPLKVWVEMNPDLYTLAPDDEFTVIYEQDLPWPGLGLHTMVYEGVLQIYLQDCDNAEILVNGHRVEPENCGTTV